MRIPQGVPRLRDLTRVSNVRGSLKLPNQPPSKALKFASDAFAIKRGVF